MKPPLPPELIKLGDELERDVRARYVERPVRRQLALGVLATLVITVPMAISVTGAELSRPVSELGNQPSESTPTSTATSDAARALAQRRAVSDVLPRGFRRGLDPDDPSPYLVEPSPLRPALR